MYGEAPRSTETCSTTPTSISSGTPSSLLCAEREQVAGECFRHLGPSRTGRSLRRHLDRREAQRTTGLSPTRWWASLPCSSGQQSQTGCKLSGLRRQGGDRVDPRCGGETSSAGQRESLHDVRLRVRSRGAVGRREPEGGRHRWRERGTVSGWTGGSQRAARMGPGVGAELEAGAGATAGAWWTAAACLGGDG
jgi:hypothetical protein